MSCHLTGKRGCETVQIVLLNVIIIIIIFCLNRMKLVVLLLELGAILPTLLPPY